MNKCDKNVKEISAASIQKDLLTLEEQEVCFSPAHLILNSILQQCMYVHVCNIASIASALVWPASPLIVPLSRLQSQHNE
jgi:hypothetical protein